jgi:hypothetical protein
LDPGPWFGVRQLGGLLKRFTRRSSSSHLIL